MVDIQSGKLALNVARSVLRPGESIEVRTRRAIAAVRGTKAFWIVTPVSSGERSESRFYLECGPIAVFMLPSPLVDEAAQATAKTIFALRRGHFERAYSDAA